MNTFSRPSSSLSPKGQLRCFQCRLLIAPRDGNWHNQGNQQRFLCKTCEKAQQQQAADEAPKAKKTR